MMNISSCYWFLFLLFHFFLFQNDKSLKEYCIILSCTIVLFTTIRSRVCSYWQWRYVMSVQIPPWIHSLFFLYSSSILLHNEIDDSPFGFTILGSNEWRMSIINTSLLTSNCTKGLIMILIFFEKNRQHVKHWS